MLKFTLSLSEPVRMFRDYGDLIDGAIVDFEPTEDLPAPPDGDTWSWAALSDDGAKAAEAAAKAAAAEAEAIAAAQAAEQAAKEAAAAQTPTA